MAKPSRTAKWMIAGGTVLLALTAAAHLFLAYPGLRRAIAAGRIVEAPDVTPGLVEAAWIIVGSDLVLLTVLLALQLAGGHPDRRVIAVVGLVPLAGGLIIWVFTPGFQLPVALLLAAAALLLLGAWRL